jgi:hypothetical protein
MQDIWYSDKRDLFKWGGIAELARSEDITNVIQVAFLRHANRPSFTSDTTLVPLPDAVWNHFRDPTKISVLGVGLGLTIVPVIDIFSHASRKAYLLKVLQQLSDSPGPKIVFLDPDTGIEPTAVNAKHVLREEISAIWESLCVNDWLVLYQHARRTKNWIAETMTAFSSACRSSQVRLFKGGNVAHDVVLLAAKRT